MDKKWWNINLPLSYNALFNFIVGLRSGGKSYGCKLKAINEFLKNGKQFAYIRRYDEEYKDSAGEFFADLIENEEFPNHEFEHKGNKFYCDKKVMGHGFVLSKANKKKSVQYPKVDFIFFDEFMLDPKKRMTDRYLPNEVDTFLNLYITIARTRDVKVFFVANALSWVNPYFVYFKVEKPRNKHAILVKNDVLIQLFSSEKLIEEMNKKRFYKMIKGTEVYNHAVENEFIRDNNNFICKPFAKMRYFFTIKVKNEKYGVYLAVEQGVIYVSENYEKNFALTYVTITENHEPNMMLTTGNGSPPFKKFVEMFKSGCVFYDGLKSKNAVFETMKGK